MPRNKFITFEGGEGAGKSTQIKLLAEHLRAGGHDVIVTREPGGTPNGEKIRELLLHGEGWDGFSEVLLNFAARNEHVVNVIKPALHRGAWVLCDRFFDSTIVYQGYGQGVDVAKIREVQNAALGNFAPDITFLLDINVKTALARATEHNRYEKMGIEFHQKIRAGFLKLAAQEPRVKIIDASGKIEEIHKKITCNL